MAINTSMSESSEECVTDTAQVFQIPSENQSGCEAEPSLALRTFLAYPASPVAAASVPAFVPPTGSASREWTYIEGVCAVEAYMSLPSQKNRGASVERLMKSHNSQRLGDYLKPH